MKSKIIKIKDLQNIRQKHKNLKIGLCSGCYDVLHSGHAIFFEQCKKFADILVVAVGKDEMIKQQKGQTRPVNPENNRVYLVASLQNVDYAILAENKLLPGKIDFYNIMKNLKPDVFVLNNDNSAIKEKKELCDKFAVELKLVKRTVPKFLKATSSTDIIEKINQL